MSKPIDETKALQRILALLLGLDSDARRRVIEYVVNRLNATESPGANPQGQSKA